MPLTATLSPKDTAMSPYTISWLETGRSRWHSGEPTALHSTHIICLFAGLFAAHVWMSITSLGLSRTLQRPALEGLCWDHAAIQYKKSSCPKRIDDILFVRIGWCERLLFLSILVPHPIQVPINMLALFSHNTGANAKLCLNYGSICMMNTDEVFEVDVSWHRPKCTLKKV